MYFIVTCGPHFVKLKIDRINKKLEQATDSGVSCGRFIPRPFWRLFGDKKDDMEEATKEMNEMESKTDEEFEIHLVKEFLKIGYVLAKKDKEIINQKEYYKNKNITIDKVIITKK